MPNDSHDTLVSRAESFGDTGSLQLPERRLNLDDAKVQNQENDDGE